MTHEFNPRQEAGVFYFMGIDSEQKRSSSIFNCNCPTVPDTVACKCGGGYPCGRCGGSGELQIRRKIHKTDCAVFIASLNKNPEKKRRL